MNIFLDRDVLRMSTMSRQVISSLLLSLQMKALLTVLQNKSKSRIFQHCKDWDISCGFFNHCESFWIKYDVMSLQMSISIDWWCYYLLLQVWWTSFDFFKMDGYQISFQFQVGLVRDRVTVDSASLNLKSIKSKACDFICEKFPQNGLTRLDERILLFKHDYKSTNILQVSIWKSTFLMTIHYSKTQFLSKNSTFETTHKIFFTQFWFSISRNLDTKMTFI